MEKSQSRKEQILWYIGRIVDQLTEPQKRTIIAMLEKFWRQRKE